MAFLVESVTNQSSSEIYVFSRNKEGEKEITRVKDFSPYFYIPSDDEVKTDYRITTVEDGFKSIDDTPLKKINVKKSKDVFDLKNTFSKSYEADIHFAQRYIIDVLGEVDTYPLKIMFLDIELDSKNDFPNMQEPDQAIICISYMDSFTATPMTLILNNGNNNIPENENIKLFMNEEDMLSFFISEVNRIDPDIISGWNVEYFDLVYMLRRMNQLFINVSALSPLKYVNISDRTEDVTIKGRIIIDMMKAYKHFRGISNQGKAESYSLEFTAKQELNQGKIPHIESFHDMWINKPEDLIKYNIRDIELVYKLNEKLKIIDFFNSIRAKSCAQLKDIYASSILIDGLLLRRVRGQIVLPDRNRTGGEEYGGAFVVPPVAGLYENVFAFDVKGMYPNIIKTFNMGYETLSKDGELKIDGNISFKKGVGLISQTVRDLEKERNHYKKLMKNATTEEERRLYHFRQYAVKVLMNSIYGYLGFPKSRLYKKEVASAITFIGRELIKWTKQFVESQGYRVVYGDTDSCYVQAKSSNLIQLLNEGVELQNKINESYKQFTKARGADECTLEVEFEKIFKTILFVSKKDSDEGAKKKYAYIPLWLAGKTVKDEIDSTGFDMVRSDNTRVARETQKVVLEMILRKKSKEDIVNYLKTVVSKIRKKEYTDEEIGFPKGITEELGNYGGTKMRGGKEVKVGTPPVVTGARYANKYLGTRFSKGSKPKWVYIKSVPLGYPDTNIITYEENIPSGFIPDYDMIVEKSIKAKLESLFEAAGFGSIPNLEKENKWF